MLDCRRTWKSSEEVARLPVATLLGVADENSLEPGIPGFGPGTE
jgi:hypothetical protein